MDKKIILEFTPEEIRLLAYGAVPSDLKERMREVAYFIDDQEKTVTTFKEGGYEKRILRYKKGNTRLRKNLAANYVESH